MKTTHPLPSPSHPPADAGGDPWPELERLVGAALAAGLSTLVRGRPGVGKSALARALAAKAGLPLVDIRLAQREPADLSGVYFPDPATRTLVSHPPAWAVEARARPTFVFLDELNAAVTRLQQAAAYQIVLERRAGEVEFHPGTVVMAAGNLEDDAAITTPLSSALANRFAHFVLRVDAPTWVEWGRGAGLDPAILAYVERFGDEVLHARGEDTDAFPSPRSWEMASRVLARAEPRDRLRLVAACVGPSAAHRFFAWLQLRAEVDPERAIRGGQTFDFTRGGAAEPSFVHAVVQAMAAWLRTAPALDAAEHLNVVRFLRSPGLDPEYALLLLKQVRANARLFAGLRGLAEFRAFADGLVQVAAPERR